MIKEVVWIYLWDFPTTRLPTACSERRGRKRFGSVRVPWPILRLKKMQGGDQPTDWHKRNGICTVLSLTSSNRLLLLLSLLSLIPVQVPGVVTVQKGLAWSASVNRECSSSPKRKCWARDDSYRLFTDRFDSLSEEGARWWRCVLFTNTLWLGNFLFSDLNQNSRPVFQLHFRVSLAPL